MAVFASFDEMVSDLKSKCNVRFIGIRSGRGSSKYLTVSFGPYRVSVIPRNNVLMYVFKNRKLENIPQMALGKALAELIVENARNEWGIEFTGDNIGI